MPRRSTPDRLLVAKLMGVAERHAAKSTPTDEAVAELQVLARGRADLLAHVAGTELGAAETGRHPDWPRRAAELCMAAGADETLIPAVQAEVRERLTRPLYQSHG